MLQRYKLRLGDGTVLGVDQEGLRTWVVDGQAMVQAAGTQQWYPLKEFLARERAAARRAAKLSDSARRDMPVVAPRPLPLVYPTPRADKASPQAAPEASEPPPFLAEAPEIQVLAETTPRPPLRHPKQIPIPDRARPVVPIQARPLQPVEALEPNLQAFVEDPAEVQALATEPVVAQAFAEEPVEAPVLTAEPMAVPALVEDPADEPIFAVEPVPAVGDPEPAWIPDDGTAALPPPLDDRDEAAGPAPLFAANDAVEPLFMDEPLGVQVAVDEPAPSRESDREPTTLAMDVPWIARPPLEDDVPDDLPLRPAPPPAPEPLVPRTGSPRPSLQVLADDLAPPARHGTKKQPPPSTGDGLDIIPLKPLDDEPRPAARLAAREASRHEVDEPPRRSELEEKLIGWLARAYSAYDTLLTGWIGRYLAHRSESMARRSESVSAHRSEPIPAHRSESISAREPAPTPPATPREDSDRIPIPPPPPLRDLPVLRLADIPEPAEEGDVYQGESRLAAAARWTLRIAIAGSLVAGGLFAVLRWQTWVPRAEQLGRSAFTRIDQAKQARDHAAQQRQALQEATERLPHLAPETIRLLMAYSPSVLLDPPEMLRVASDAADRGAKALSLAEVRELRAIQGELLGSLRPSERDRIREYHAARLRRLVFPFEGKDVLELFARGTYALPPERRERLQELFAKAIADGLPVSPAAPPGPAAQP